MKPIRLLLFVTSLLASTISASAQASLAAVVEKRFPFPSPLEWRLRPDNHSAEISLIGVVWGPSSAPEMISKARELLPNEQAQLATRYSHVIALHFRARIDTPLLSMMTRSGLVRVKDADGNTEWPWDLTSSGLVAQDYDIHFTKGNVTTEYWDFFPVTPDQKEFLFQVHTPAERVSYFTVVLNGKDLVVDNATPPTPSACLDFDKTFDGSIGARSVVSMQIQRERTGLSGMGEYVDGRIVQLTGGVDLLGRFVLQENEPKGQEIGILKGSFNANFQTMTGYFSTPDGSQLQPFELRQVQVPGIPESSPSQPNCDMQSAAEPPAR